MNHLKLLFLRSLQIAIFPPLFLVSPAAMSQDKENPFSVKSPDIARRIMNFRRRVQQRALEEQLSFSDRMFEIVNSAVEQKLSPEDVTSSVAPFNPIPPEVDALEMPEKLAEFEKLFSYEITEGIELSECEDFKMWTTIPRWMSIVVDGWEGIPEGITGIAWFEGEPRWFGGMLVNQEILKRQNALRESLRGPSKEENLKKIWKSFLGEWKGLATDGPLRDLTLMITGDGDHFFVEPVEGSFPFLDREKNRIKLDPGPFISLSIFGEIETQQFFIDLYLDLENDKLDLIVHRKPFDLSSGSLLFRLSRVSP